jgi:hypothetical protein
MKELNFTLFFLLISSFAFAQGCLPEGDIYACKSVSYGPGCRPCDIVDLGALRKYRIPIDLVIIQDDDGNGVSVTGSQFVESLGRVNLSFSESNVEFYLSRATVLQSDQFTSIDRDDLVSLNIFMNNSLDGEQGIKVAVVNDYGTIFDRGAATEVIVAYERQYVNSESAVLTHELGHLFGLFHTYDETCGNSECGDQSCDTDDLIFDTPKTTDAIGCSDNNIMGASGLLSDNRQSFTDCQNRKMYDMLFSCQGDKINGSLESPTVAILFQNGDQVVLGETGGGGEISLQVDGCNPIVGLTADLRNNPTRSTIGGYSDFQIQQGVDSILQFVRDVREIDQNTIADNFTEDGNYDILVFDQANYNLSRISSIVTISISYTAQCLNTCQIQSNCLTYQTTCNGNSESSTYNFIAEFGAETDGNTYTLTATNSVGQIEVMSTTALAGPVSNAGNILSNLDKNETYIFAVSQTGNPECRDEVMGRYFPEITYDTSTDLCAESGLFEVFVTLGIGGLFDRYTVTMPNRGIESLAQGGSISHSYVSESLVNVIVKPDDGRSVNNCSTFSPEFSLLCPTIPDPDCLPPNSFASTVVNGNSVSLDWTLGTGGDTYDIAYFIIAQGAESGTVITNVFGQSTSINNLDYATEYRVGIQTNCTGDDSGLNSTTFTTGAAPVDNSGCNVSPTITSATTNCENNGTYTLTMSFTGGDGIVFDIFTDIPDNVASVQTFPNFGAGQYVFTNIPDGYDFNIIVENDDDPLNCIDSRFITAPNCDAPSSNCSVPVFTVTSTSCSGNTYSINFTFTGDNDELYGFLAEDNSGTTYSTSPGITPTSYLVEDIPLGTDVNMFLSQNGVQGCSGGTFVNAPTCSNPDDLCDPPTVSLDTPANGSTFNANQNIDFNWTLASGGNNCSTPISWIEFSLTGNFSGSVQDESTFDNAWIEDFRNPGSNPVTIYWRVRTYRTSPPSQYGAYSPVRSFTILPDGSNVCGTPTGPTVTNITSGSATLNWNPAPGADNYIYAYDNGSLTSGSTGLTTVDITGLEPGTTYSWGVIAECGNINGDAIASSFTTTEQTGDNSENNGGCGEPEITSLSDRDDGERVQVKFNTVPTEVTYTVFYRNLINGSVSSVNASPSSSIPPPPSSITESFNSTPGDQFEVWVSVDCFGGSESRSASRFITIPYPDCSNPPGQLSTFDITSDQASVTWDFSSSGQEYDMELYTGDEAMRLDQQSDIVQ